LAGVWAPVQSDANPRTADGESSADSSESRLLKLRDATILSTSRSACELCSLRHPYCECGGTDVNHGYMTDKMVAEQTIENGWTAEGEDPGIVVMCAPR